jgi:hypothetical protein
MIRYFFDCVATDRSLYDYKGSEFPNLEAARDFAEAMAQNLRDSLNNEWIAWSIDVRSAEGKRLITLPIGHAVPIAA